MKTDKVHIATAVTILTFAFFAFALSGESGAKEVGRTTEKELNVVISMPFGKLLINKGEPEKIFVGELLGGESASHELLFDYHVRNRVGFLDLSLGDPNEGNHKKGSLKISEFTGSKSQMNFSTAIPISFDIELGLARGVFDLSGLQVKDFSLSCGASDVVIAFDSPNGTSLEEMNIECGVGKFEGRNLGNAKFKHFRFEGGVGSATLDFSGKISKEVDVDVQVGMGICTIILPREVGARIFYEESIVSRIDLAKDIRTDSDNQYTSDNYKSASARMNIRIEAGMGNVKIKRQ
jgi:hypothetical protein